MGDIAGRRARTQQFYNILSTLAPPVPDVESQDYHTPAPDGHSLLLRWYRKTTPTEGVTPGAAILYAHGGGMISGSVQHYDSIMKAFVARTGVPFLAVDYRLAPEVRAPVPVTDLYAGLVWLYEHAAELGVDPARIGVAGDSAGGGLAACLTHYVKREKAGVPAIQRQILVYPMLDDRTVEQDRLIAPFAIWSSDDNATGWGALLGDRRGKDDVSVIEAAGRMTVEDAKGLPPTYIDVGELDLFRDEILAYAATLGKAGVSCELHVIPGAPHGFEGMAPESDIVKLCLAARTRHARSL